MKTDYFEQIEANPVIAAVKNDQGLDTCCNQCEDIKVVFILYGDVCNIGTIVQKVKSAGKIAIVHVDLIDGLSSKEIAADFIYRYTEADGIISTRPAVIKHGKELGLYTILRIFVLDSMAYENIPRQLASAKPDMVEILPGLMPKVIRNVTRVSRVPVIAGGLISEKDDVMNALSAGAIAVSSTSSDVWML